MQFEFVVVIRVYQDSVKGLYLLSIVCCGGVYYYIVD